MAALMFKIANEPHPAPESINPKIPRCVSIIIHRAMHKEIENRYKRGRDMIADIDKCLHLMEGNGNKK
jgi:serine/threonine-protein kinase